MKKTLKYIALLLALVFVLTGTAMVVYATGDDGSGGDAIDPGAGEDPGYVDPGSGEDPGTGEDPGYVDPGTGEDPGYVDPGSGEDPGYVDPGSGEDPGYVEPDPGYQEPVYYEEEDPLWYGNDDDYSTGDNDGAAGSVSDSTKLYEAKGTSDADVAPNKWTNIALDEKTVKNSNSGSFSAIQSDQSTGDNGEWMLYLGYILIALAVLGILYFIVATISARKENQRERRHNAGSNASAAYTSIDALSSLDDNSTGRTTSRHAAGRYGDGYEGSSRHVSSRADTGEIYVPRRARD